MRTLTLCVLLLVPTASFAQADPLPLPYPPPPPQAAPQPLSRPVPPPAPLTDPAAPVHAGVQFHGEFGASTTGFSASVSGGVGFNRVAILLTPSLTLASSLTMISLGISVRIYFANRQQGALVGFLHPAVLVGNAGNFGSSGLFYGGLGLGGGIEYLLTRNLGFTAEMGIAYASLNPQLGSSGFFSAFSTSGSFGLMLHQ